MQPVSKLFLVMTDNRVKVKEDADSVHLTKVPLMPKILWITDPPNMMMPEN